MLANLITYFRQENGTREWKGDRSYCLVLASSSLEIPGGNFSILRRSYLKGETVRLCFLLRLFFLYSDVDYRPVIDNMKNK